MNKGILSIVVGLGITGAINSKAEAVPISIADPAGAIEKSGIILGLGQQRLLHLPGLLKYSFGSNIVRSLPLPSAFKTKTSSTHKDTLLIKAVTKGKTDFWAWMKNGITIHRTIEIRSWKDHHYPLGFQKALSSLIDIEVIPVGKHTVLRGEIRTIQEAARISGLMKAYPDSLEDQTKPSQKLLGEAAKKIKTWIEETKHSFLLEPKGHHLLVRGSVASKSEKELAEQSIAEIYPLTKLQINILKDQAPTIYFRIFLTEMNRDGFSSVGLDWPLPLEGAFRLTPWKLDSSVNLDLTLKALSGKGLVNILAKPELVVRAPGKAELFAGGEIPIESKSKFQSNVSWRKFGLSIMLDVQQAMVDRVRLDVQTEVSHMDSKLASGKVPGFHVNKIKTQVDSHFGRPLLLCGLLKKGTREEVRGLPFLRKIPILGYLFGSKDYLDQRSELVVILIPSSTPPGPELRFDQDYPRGPVPPPRNQISDEKIHALKMSPDYPWNALGETAHD